MGEIISDYFSLSKTGTVEFKDNKFKMDNNNDKVKSTGELIADYITSSIHNFSNDFDGVLDGREFILFLDDYSPSDSFLEAKNKIDIIVENRLDLDQLNFAIDFLKYIKHIETKLVLNMKVNAQGYFVSDYAFKGFYLEFELYPDSWLKSFKLEYDGRELIKVSEYMEFGIKVIEYVYGHLSLFDTRLRGNEYSDAIEWLLKVKNHFNLYPF